MKSISILKKNKKIKVNIQEELTKLGLINKILTVSGPLGEIKYTFKNQVKNDQFYQIFIPGKNINFFTEKIKKLIQSVTTG